MSATLLKKYENVDKLKRKLRFAENDLKASIRAYAAENKMCVPHPDTLRANLQGR